MAQFLWNLADISKLRGSSGQDYLLCNSNLKTPVGFPNHCYRKEMFRIPQSLQLQEESIEYHHHNAPVLQDHVEGEPGQQLGQRTVNLYNCRIVCKVLPDFRIVK